MLNSTMQKAVDDFVLNRINACGAQEPVVLQEAFEELTAATSQLEAQLPEQLKPLLNRCENAVSIADGETMQVYYRAGFADAIEFIFGWRNQNENQM